MNEDWIKVYTSDQVYKIMLVKGVLEENNIKSFEVNKKDSSYGMIGEVELYVQQGDSILARFIIQENSL